jgi:hypothetical protein
MTPNSSTQIPLDQLNELIAKDKGVEVKDLALNEENKSPETKKQASVPNSDSEENKKLVAEAPFHPGYEGAVIETSKQDGPVTASDLRSMADKLFKEAQALRRKADEMEPPKAKTTKVKKAATVNE